jgi:hypothetical protein
VIITDSARHQVLVDHGEAVAAQEFDSALLGGDVAALEQMRPFLNAEPRQDSA